MDLQIAGKVALVCGAGSGLGRAMALALAAEGVTVAVTGRSREKLDQTVQLIERQRGKAQAWTLDLARPDEFDSVLHDIRRHAGPIGILVNNSGGPPPSTAAGVAPAVWQQQFNTMVSSLIQLTDQVLPDMRAAGWGRIITSTSSGVEAPIANLGISNTLRLALLGWSKTLAGEVASQGITANILVPGRIATDRVGQLDAARAGREGSSQEQVKANSIASIPVGRYGDPQEYGAAAAFLASQQAAYITGAVLRIDGGLIPAL
ncbi:SDR family oxidoreductase [Biostraticola tofi]|uniref:3-oxoacyl-[acyl-carrier protein] reductase n=1 Tax=Biostraticola tofi TaxID=466109 RepID=A0A4R3Z105_9GAMM|nr:SDR family oxidoreductase [Biostraticola tofi]TCV98736.1 3-oxoacyl-[acyl-carrier protein] reductase [Biostraticola tofi]